MASKFDTGLILAACLTLLIIESLRQPGLPAAADIPIHLYRTMEYQQAWSEGVILPRWAPNLAFGYGYPLFVFAPPLPYWLGLAFHALGLSFANALKALIILTMLLYATGMYLLARDLLNSVQAGLIAATAYIFAPFALREALLYGGNLPQLLAIGFFPWTLWAMSRIKSNNSSWIILSALFYSNILLSHLFHALIFTPVMVLFGVMLAFCRTGILPVRSEQARCLSYNLLPIPLAWLLTAFFWLPALVERSITRAQADIYLQKSPFFIRYPHWTELVAWIYPLDARAANPYVPLTLGIITLSLAIIGVTGQILLAIKSKILVTDYKSVASENSTSYFLPPTSYLLPPTSYYRLWKKAKLPSKLNDLTPKWIKLPIGKITPLKLSQPTAS